MPELHENDVIVNSSTALTAFTDIARKVDTSATGYHKERRRTLETRCQKVAEYTNDNTNQYVVWCGMNDEADRLRKLIPDAVEIRGSDKPEKKESAAMGFVAGNVRVLISKPSIFGYGLNFQNCHNSLFCGMDYSFENYYQAVRRFYRFGQKHEVNIWRVLGDTEKNILDAINRKASMKEQMQHSMADAVREFQTTELNTYHLDLGAKSYNMPTWLKGA